MVTDGLRLTHENRHAHPLSFGPGKPPHPGGQSGSGRAHPGRGGRDLRSSPADGRALGQGIDAEAFGRKAKKRGRPKGGTLLPWQAAQIVRTITDRTPDQLKLPFYLWTREAVGRLIEDRFGIQLSVWTVGRYLARWGVTPQKPARLCL